MQVDLRALIQEVRVSPFASSRFHHVVENVVAANGFDFPVGQSDLALDPLY